ncbi:hypothetical protein B0O99DRAFT_332455 [Bisporella sp. PMI_857]|nr:hypothetical protein B0O99DRAFT_332455 [Bisporella sp. PMI_857]
MYFGSLCVFILWFLSAGPSFVSAQGLAALYTSSGNRTGQIIAVQDPSTSGFLCNSYSSTGYSSPQSVPVTTVPKNGTAVAIAGYSNSFSIYGYLFYQAAKGGVMLVVVKCSYASGLCVNYQERNITVNATVPVHQNTRLTASLISTWGGFRVNYEDAYGSIRQVSYANSTSEGGTLTDWADGELVGNATGTENHAFSSAYIKTNLTIAPSSQMVYQISNGQIKTLTNTIYKNWTNETSQLWTSITSERTNLPFLPLANATFASVRHLDWYCLFYVGTNKQLQFMRSTDGGQNWSAEPPMGASTWPAADEPNAPIAAIKTGNSSAVFYSSGKKIVQLNLTDQNWLPYTVVEPTVIPANTTSNTTIPQINPPKQNSDPIKRPEVIGGIAAGSAVFIILVLVLGWLFYRKKSKSKAVKILDSEDEEKSRDSSDYDYSGKAELHGESDINELDHDPECLLLHQLQLRRHFELLAKIPVELDGSTCRCEIDTCIRHELPTCSGKDEDTRSTRTTRTTRTRASCASKRRDESSTALSTTSELPSWTWVVLRRLAEELEEVEAQNRREKGKEADRGSVLSEEIRMARSLRAMSSKAESLRAELPDPTCRIYKDQKGKDESSSDGEGEEEDDLYSPQETDITKRAQRPKLSIQSPCLPSKRTDAHQHLDHDSRHDKGTPVDDDIVSPQTATAAKPNFSLPLCGGLTKARDAQEDRDKNDKAQSPKHNGKEEEGDDIVSPLSAKSITLPLGDVL